MPLLDGGMRDAWLWLGASVAVAILWSNLSWLFAPWAERSEKGPTSGSLAETIVSRMANWRFASSVFQVLRGLYFLGLPAAALFWGRDAVIGRFLGLKPLVLPNQIEGGQDALLSAAWSAWAYDLGSAATIGVGAGLLLFLAALARRRALTGMGSDRTGPSRSPLLNARETLYHEAHWAFYRNAPIVALGPYWGPWTGLALAGIEALLNPHWRTSLNSPGSAWQAMSQAALAVVSTLLFLQTQNVWLALLAHWGIACALGTVYSSTLDYSGERSLDR